MLQVRKEKGTPQSSIKNLRIPEEGAVQLRISRFQSSRPMVHGTIVAFPTDTRPAPREEDHVVLTLLGGSHKL